MTDHTDIADDLHDALDALFRAFARLGVSHDQEPPQEALDEALAQDPAYQDAREAFSEALESGSVMKVEAAHHQAVDAAVEVGWLVAVSTFSPNKETHS